MPITGYHTRCKGDETYTYIHAGKVSRDRKKPISIKVTPAAAGDSRRKISVERVTLPSLTSKGGALTRVLHKMEEENKKRLRRRALVPSTLPPLAPAAASSSTIKTVAKTLFPGLKHAARTLRGTPHPRRTTEYDRFSVVLQKGSAALLLGQDVLFFRMCRSDYQWVSASSATKRYIRFWDRHSVSDSYNPHNIKHVLSFGTRYDEEAFAIPLSEVKHKTFFVEDFFTTVSGSKANMISLLSQTSGAPKELFDCEIEEVAGKPPFPPCVFQIKKGSLKSRIPASQWFVLPFKQIVTSLAKGETVFVHCAQGVSRSATILILFFMYAFDLSKEDAYRFLQEKRSIVYPNPLWKSLIREYEAALLAEKAGTL